MKILAIDTSGPVCGVCVMRDGVVRCEHTVQNKLTHSATLMPMIRDAMDSTGIGLGELDRIAAVVGPGSFTGVRIGVSTVRGLTAGCGVPCVPVDALEALAAGCAYFDGVICPIQDARAGQVYGAAFLRGNDGMPVRLLPDEPVALETFLDRLKELPEGRSARFLFTGDGMPVHREKILERMGDRADTAMPQNAFLRPSVVAYLASKSAETVPGKELVPFYLRPPSAEKNRKLLEAMKNV